MRVVGGHWLAGPGADIWACWANGAVAGASSRTMQKEERGEEAGGKRRDMQAGWVTERRTTGLPVSACAACAAIFWSFLSLVGAVAAGLAAEAAVGVVGQEQSLAGRALAAHIAAFGLWGRVSVLRPLLRVACAATFAGSTTAG